jgi:hypothetical protein
MGAPIGNRNAAGSRGGSATRRMRAALLRGKTRRTLSRLTGKKSKYADTPGGRSARLYDLAHRLNKRRK